MHPEIAFSGRKTYFALIIGGAFIRFMRVQFVLKISIMLSPIYNFRESETQKMVYRFFRMQDMEDCVRVVESNNLYFDKEWKVRVSRNIPITIPFPKKIYDSEFSLVYAHGKYVLKFNPEERLVHHIKNELLVYRHIVSNEIPNTIQFVSYIESENHLLLLFEGHGEKVFVHEYFYEIISCLQHFHARVMHVHRDIRPANIVFINKKPCLIDFAFSQPLLPPNLTKTECLNISTVFENRLDLTQEDFTEERLPIILKGCTKKKTTLLGVCGFIHRYFMERVGLFPIGIIIGQIVDLFAKYIEYLGSNETASNRILQLLENNRKSFYCTPADDLHSAIKSYCMFRCQRLRNKVMLNRGHYNSLISIWDQFIGQNAFLTQYFKLAEDLDYEGLIELFRTDSRLMELNDIPPPPNIAQIQRIYNRSLAHG